MKLIGVALFLLVASSGAMAQRTQVTMKNGSVFSGLIVTETETHLDIEIGDGRLRLAKAHILRRADEKKKVAAKTKEPASSANGDSGAPSPLAKLLKNRAKTDESENKALVALRGDAQIGKRAGNSATSLGSAPLPVGTPEHAVASFLRLIAQGRSDEAVARWVEVSVILERFFPRHAPALTKYSKVKATQSWVRILRMVFSDPKLMASVRSEGIEVRTVREDGHKSLVEVSLPLPDKPSEVETFLIGLRGNRIVDFGNLLHALKKVCQGLSTQLAASGSWVLVPLLDKTADRILAVRRGDGDLSKMSVPKVKELRTRKPKTPVEIDGEKMIRGESEYRLVIPTDWDKTPEVSLPEFADSMIEHASRKAYAMVLVEPAEMALAALERAARANLSQVADSVNIHLRRSFKIKGGGEGVKFRADTVVFGVPLVYHYALITTPRRAYQVIAWSLKSVHDMHESTLEQILSSFVVLPPKESGKAPGKAAKGAKAAKRGAKKPSLIKGLGKIVPENGARPDPKKGTKESLRK